MDRPKTLPEQRGHDMQNEREGGEKPYTKESYASQYGITVEEAEELRDRYQTHGEVKRAILHMVLADPARARRLRGGNEIETGVGGPLIDSVAGFETVGSVVNRSHMLKVSDPTPTGALKGLGVEKARKLAREVMHDKAFEEWLDNCMKRGDHNLARSDAFHWNDIPEENLERLRWFLAMRWLEASGEEGAA